MKKVFAICLFLTLILFFSIATVSAETILEPISISEDSSIVLDRIISPDAQARIDAKIQKEKIFEVIIAILAVISLAALFFISKFMIRRYPIKIDIFLHSLIFIGTLALSIAGTIDWVRWFSDHNWATFDLGVLIFLLPAYLALIFSAFLIWGGKRYSRNMSISVVLSYFLFLVLVLIVEMIYGTVYDFPAIIGYAILAIPVMLPLYVIFAIIGMFLDNKYNL